MTVECFAAAAAAAQAYTASAVVVTAASGKKYTLPATGVMQFDSADAASMDASGSLDDVILHEMGHVIGIGQLWSTAGWGGVYTGTQNVYTTKSGKYAGAAGNDAYVAEVQV